MSEKDLEARVQRLEVRVDQIFDMLMILDKNIVGIVEVIKNLKN